MNNKFNILLTAIITALFCSCQGGGSNQMGIPKTIDTNETSSGLRYVMHEKNKGEKAKIGDFLTLNIKYTTPGDSALFSTFENPKPITMQFQKTLFNGVINDGITMMAAGDSATFFVKADKVYKGNFPKFVKDGNDEFKYIVKMIKIQNQDELQKDKKQKEQAFRMKNDKEIAEFLQAKGIKAEKLDNGLYYKVDKKGNGEFAKAGQTVEVHYHGTLLDGTKFDSSKDRNQTFKFQLGQGRVIQGWDLGIPLFSKGGTGTLYIPSHLGYGDRGAGPKIPGGAVLIFDIEMIDFK